MADNLGHSFPCSAQLAKNVPLYTFLSDKMHFAFHWYYINSFTRFSYFHFLKYGRFSHHPCSLPQNVKPPVEYFPTNKTEMSLEDRQPSGAVTDQSQIGNHHYSNQRQYLPWEYTRYILFDVLERVVDVLLPEKSLDRWWYYGLYKGFVFNSKGAVFS